MECNAMCRCHQNRLSRVRVLGVTPKAVVVTGGMERHAIGFPPHDVFELEEDLAAQIEDALAKQDSKKVAELWSRAVPFDTVDTPAFNRA